MMAFIIFKSIYMSFFDSTASPTAKLENILIHLYNVNHSPKNVTGNAGGKTIELYNCFSTYDPKVFGVSTRDEMKFYLETLIKMNFLEKVDNQEELIPGPFQSYTNFPKTVRLTFEGLKRCYDLEQTGAHSNRCFVAMVFDEEKDSRLQAIRAACQVHQYEAVDVETMPNKETVTIDAKIISAIKSSRFVIADFTKLNHGAYFEAGFALGRNMKVIFVCQKRDFDENKKHFDVNHYPFLRYDNFEDLKMQLIDYIAAVIND